MPGYMYNVLCIICVCNRDCVLCEIIAVAE